MLPQACAEQRGSRPDSELERRLYVWAGLGGGHAESGQWSSPALLQMDVHRAETLAVIATNSAVISRAYHIHSPALKIELGWNMVPRTGTNHQRTKLQYVPSDPVTTKPFLIRSLIKNNSKKQDVVSRWQGATSPAPDFLHGEACRHFSTFSPRQQWAPLSIQEQSA